MITNYSTTNGYIDIKLGDGSKRAHFGMGFIKLLHDCGTTLTEVGQDMTSKEPMERFEALSKLLWAGFTSNDLEMGIQVDYTIELCLEWAVMLDDKQEADFLAALTYATAINAGLNSMGKSTGTKSVPQ